MAGTGPAMAKRSTRTDDDETSRTYRARWGPQNGKADRARDRLRQGQDGRPRWQGPDRALGRAHQGLRGRPDAAASPATEARLPQYQVRAQAKRDQSRPRSGGDR